MTDTAQTGLGINDIIGDYRAEVLRLAEQHGAANVRVFGSVARGEARPDSDIDFLVDWDLSHNSSWGGIGFQLALEDLFKRPIEVVSVDALHWLIRDRIMREAVLL